MKQKVSDRKLLDIISRHTYPTRVGPTERDIAKDAKVTFVAVHYRLKRLQELGAVEKAPIGYVLTEQGRLALRSGK